MKDSQRRIILIDRDIEARDVLAERLRAQGFTVDTASDGATGAELALASPPSAMIADLWMPGVSGVQLCRLLRAEPATADVPLVLRADNDDPKSRFWAERAGAIALVSKGRMGELSRVLRKAVSRPATEGDFFMQFPGGTIDVRDRIAQHLDTALFESVIAAETRALAGACSFDGLFDSLSQLLAQLTSYHWLALTTSGPLRVAMHCHPRGVELAELQIRATLSLPGATVISCVRDEDAIESIGEISEIPPIVVDVPFGGATVARIALASTDPGPDAEALAMLVARELGGAIRLAIVVEESQRLATTDSLTGLLNRRAFLEAANTELIRSDRTSTSTSALLIDVDHFKQINDRLGHAAGDVVLAAMGELLRKQARPYDIVARWGGEEFVVVLPNTTAADAQRVGERLRRAIEAARIVAPTGEPIAITASVGVATRLLDESIDALLDRADRAMYIAKASGRNRVEVAPAPPVVALPSSEEELVEGEPVSGVAAA